LNRAIELQPNFVNPYISIGELLRSNNQFDLAKQYYYKGLSLDKTDMGANAYLGLAVIYSITRRDDSAIFCYQQTLRLKPYNPEAHSNFANFLDMTGQKDKAIVEYGVAIDQNPDIFQPYLNRARAYQRMNKCDDAFKDFNKALQIEPKMGEIYYARSFCYDMKGDKAAAQKDREMAGKLGFVPQR
jgi:tetratricopeptide (TPR) repeat protein